MATETAKPVAGSTLRNYRFLIRSVNCELCRWLPLLVRLRPTGLRCNRIHQCTQVFHAHQLVGEPCSHGWRDLKRLVDTHPVVEHEVERDRVDVALQLLGKAVGEAGEPAHVHAHREVLALHIARADVLFVGLALDRRLDNR